MIIVAAEMTCATSPETSRAGLNRRRSITADSAKEHLVSIVRRCLERNRLPAPYHSAEWDRACWLEKLAELRADATQHGILWTTSVQARSYMCILILRLSSFKWLILKNALVWSPWASRPRMSSPLRQLQVDHVSSLPSLPRLLHKL